MKKKIFFCVICVLYCSAFVFSTTAGADISAEKGNKNEVSSTVQTTIRNTSFILLPQELKDRLKKSKNDLVLIDVRRSVDFEKFRIPGSLNMPLYTVKTKGFLKTKSLLLINEGYGYRGLERECEKLKEFGFPSVRILYGGLSYWRETGGNLEGDFFAIERLNEITPAQYFGDHNYDDWVVVNVSLTENETEQKMIPDAINIPYSDNDQEFRLKLAKAVNGAGDPSYKYILIVDGDGKMYRKIKHTLSNDRDIHNVFYLKGGFSGYKKHLAEQEAIKNPHKKSVEKCGSCP